jgi:hypothetical protein
VAKSIKTEPINAFRIPVLLHAYQNFDDISL